MATNLPQITEYVVATFGNRSHGQIEAEPVNALIQQGWQPFGSVSPMVFGGSTIMYAQAMVRYKT
jgi:hypothetical protein